MIYPFTLSLSKGKRRITTQPPRGEGWSEGIVRVSFSGGGMKNCLNKYIWIILPIVLFFLFSYASGQQEQTESMDAAAYNNRGLTYMRKGQYDRAIPDFSKAIEIDPMYARAYYNRGIAYGKKDQHDRAIADFTKAIEIDPKYAAAYNNRGMTYLRKDQYDQAISDLTKAIEIDPRFAEDFNNRGMTYVKKGQ